jgi:hypothetical protein
MLYHASYFPFDTSTDLSPYIEPRVLSDAEQASLLAYAQTWREGDKLKKGSLIPGTQTRLKNSIIKIDGEVYELNHGELFASGTFGKIKVLRRLRDGALFLDKIFFEIIEPKSYEALLDEIAILLDTGVGLGHTSRAWQGNLTRWKHQEIIQRFGEVSPHHYFKKHHVVMRYLGPNLNKQLKEQAVLEVTQTQKEKLQRDEARVDVSIETSYALARYHMGPAFISGVGYVHRDIKTLNFTLNEQGTSVIDHGLAEKNPNRPVPIIGGTRGYCLLPMNVYDTHEYVHGVLLDLESLKRVLWGVLCDDPMPLDSYGGPKPYDRLGILSDDLVHKLKLVDCLETGYSAAYGRYLNEDELRIKNATMLTAVLIAVKLNLSEDEINHILAHEHVALSVIGTHFSNRKCANWKTEGARKLRALFQLTDDDLKERALFVSLGLSHHLDDARQDPLLCRILRSAYANVSDEIKRTAVCLFQHGLLNEKAYARLNKHEDLPWLCLEAHYTESKNRLKQLVEDEGIVEALTTFTIHAPPRTDAEDKTSLRAFKYFLDHPKSLPKLARATSMHQIEYLKGTLELGMPYDEHEQTDLMVTILSNPRAREIWRWAEGQGIDLDALKPLLLDATLLACFDALAGFTLTQKNIQVMQKHGDLLTWLCQVVQGRLKSITPVQEKLTDGVIFHMFLNVPVYRDALFYVYQSMVAGNHAEASYLVKRLCDASFSRQNQNNMLLHAQHIMQLKSKMSIRGMVRVFNEKLDHVAAELFERHPTLREQDVLWILDNTKVTPGFWDGLVSVKTALSLDTLKRAAYLFEQNHYLFHMLSLLTNQGILHGYFLSDAPIAPYVFQSGREQHKIEFLCFCSRHLDSREQLIRCLSQDSFIKAGLALKTLNILSQEHVEILADNPSLCEEIATCWDNSTVDFQLKPWIQWQLICSSTEVNKKIACWRYPLLKAVMLEINQDVKDVRQRYKAYRALITLYQAVDKIKIMFDKQGTAINTQARQKYYEILSNMDHALDTRTFQNGEYTRQLHDFVQGLDAFLVDKNCVAAVVGLESRHMVNQKPQASMFCALEAENIRHIKTAMRHIHESLDTTPRTSCAWMLCSSVGSSAHVHMTMGHRA